MPPVKLRREYYLQHFLNSPFKSPPSIMSRHITVQSCIHISYCVQDTRKGPHTIQVSNSDTHMQKSLVTPQQLILTFTSVCIHCCLLLDGCQLQRTIEFHEECWLSCSSVSRNVKKILKICFLSSFHTSLLSTRGVAYLLA